MADLHSAGHRRGVVCAPHAAAVEAGRAILAEGGNALEAMVAMAATIAAVYPHMNHLGGDGFWLIREPSGRVRAIMAPGPAGRNARPELYRDYETIPTRGPLAALTVPGAIGGWMLALQAAKANGGKLPLDVLLSNAAGHARDGYRVTRSQKQLTENHLAELKDVPGFAATFLVDGKVPAVGTTLKQQALAATLEQLAHAGLDDFYRGDIGREIAADLERIGSPVTREDLNRYEAKIAEPLRADLSRGHGLQHRRADPGYRLADDPRAVRPLGRDRGRKFRSHPRPGRGDQARDPHPRSRRHRSGLPRAPARPLSRAALHRRRSDEDRPPQGGALAAGRRRRRHDLDGRGRRFGPRRVLHPVALLGIRLRLRAAGDRRADAKPRRELFAAKRRAQSADARPAADPHAQSGAGGARETAASWPTAAWAATASRRPKAHCSRAT